MPHNAIQNNFEIEKGDVTALCKISNRKDETAALLQNQQLKR
jgi:hypothetical protein